MKKILLVEDDASIVSSLTVFMKNEGYLVDSADGQRTALQKITQKQYDIMLLDISLYAEQMAEMSMSAAKILPLTLHCRLTEF